MIIKIMFGHVALWERFDATCVWFASRSDVAFTFDVRHSNTGEHFQLLGKESA